MSDEQHINSLAAAIAAGTALAAPVKLDSGALYATVPDGHNIEDLEHFLEQPIRMRGAVMCETVASFVEYFNRFKDEASMVFADSPNFEIVGILDYHSDEPAFGEHRALYTAPRSDEWNIWTKGNKKPMKQAEFSQFIEDNVKDIREPAGADVLEIARQLEVKKNVEFASAERLSDGQRQFTYNETVAGTSRKGKLKIPEEFTLGVPVFKDDECYAVTARLRYRMDDGNLFMWYDLLNPHEVERNAFGRIVDAVKKDVDVPVIMGRVDL